MAANLQTRGFASFGKRFVKGNWIGSSRDPSSPVSAVKRGVHFSVYDKNVDDQVRPTVVPDDVIDPPSDKYWAPHPQTGVFGPPSSTAALVGAATHPCHSPRMVRSWSSRPGSEPSTASTRTTTLKI